MFTIQEMHVIACKLSNISIQCKKKFVTYIGYQNQIRQDFIQTLWLKAFKPLMMALLHKFWSFENSTECPTSATEKRKVRCVVARPWWIGTLFMSQKAGSTTLTCILIKFSTLIHIVQYTICIKVHRVHCIGSLFLTLPLKQQTTLKYFIIICWVLYGTVFHHLLCLQRA